MTVLKCLKNLWIKIRPYTSKRCCAVFLFIWDLLIQNPLRFLQNPNTGCLWLQKSRKIARFCPFYLFSQTNKTNSTAAHKFKSLLLRKKKSTPRCALLFYKVEIRVERRNGARGSPMARRRGRIKCLRVSGSGPKNTSEPRSRRAIRWSQQCDAALAARCISPSPLIEKATFF